MSATVTKEQVSAALQALAALAEAIRDLGEVPSGHLYAVVMSSGMSLATYQSMIDRLKGAGLIAVDGSHLIRWTGPK